MTQESDKKTLLHDWHVSQGANLGGFGGYEMPVWYPSGAKNEHLAVLESAGVFDTSHMAVVKIAGPDAFDLLGLCFSRDLSACVGKGGPIEPGRCVYGVFLNDKGHVIDDAIVYKTSEENDFLIVVNAGMGGPVADHLRGHSTGKSVAIEDLTDNVGKMDIQGPAAGKILSKLLASPEKVFEKMPYFSFKGHFDSSVAGENRVRLTDGTDILLSRSGYTGEFGFEIFVAPERFVALWNSVIKAGEEFGAICCGLAARDSLRAGAVLPLSHQDIGHWPFVNNPWTFALPYGKDGGFTKEFIGRNALENIENPEFTYPFAGNDLRKITVDDDAAVFDSENNKIGTVLTCVTDMGIGRADGKIFSVASPDKPDGFVPKGLCCGYVKVSMALKNGQIIEIRDKRRKLKVMVTDDVRPNRTARRPIREMI